MNKSNMKSLDPKELKEIIQSGHINILIGSGCSLDYLSTLKDIETKMNKEETRVEAKRSYYKLINKSKAILDESLEKDDEEQKKLVNTKQNYDNFLKFWADKISQRSLHIVNKQINIFTTNFDMFLEDSCERLNIHYNDGFNGQIKPIFQVSNFNKIYKYKSLQFDNTSDIPLFNIMKLHGSISCLAQDKEIIYSNGSHIPNNLYDKTDEDFEIEYNKIPLINPRAEKHFETVLDTNYASLLRKFTLELEKENSALIIVGFSMDDSHIKNLLYGVMQSNPTLIVIYFSHSKYNESIDKLRERDNTNLYIISPENDFSFEKTIQYFLELLNKKKFVNPHQDE